MLHVKHSSGMSTARVTREVIDLEQPVRHARPVETAKLNGRRP